VLERVATAAIDLEDLDGLVSGNPEISLLPDRHCHCWPDRHQALGQQQLGARHFEFLFRGFLEKEIGGCDKTLRPSDTNKVFFLEMLLAWVHRMREPSMDIEINLSSPAISLLRHQRLRHVMRGEEEF